MKKVDPSWIPSEVELRGGAPFEVVTSPQAIEKIEKEIGCLFGMGQYSEPNQRITLRIQSPTREMVEETDDKTGWDDVSELGRPIGLFTVQDSLLHECLHGLIPSRVLPEKIEEAFIHNLTHALLAFIQRNPEAIRFLQRR